MEVGIQLRISCKQPRYKLLTRKDQTASSHRRSVLNKQLVKQTDALIPLNSFTSTDRRALFAATQQYLQVAKSSSRSGAFPPSSRALHASEPCCGSTLAFSQRVALSPRVLYKDLAQSCEPENKKTQKKHTTSAEPGLEQKASGHLPPNKAKEIPTLHQRGINRS